MSPEHFTADTVVPAKADKRMVAALQALAALEFADGRLSQALEKGLPYRVLQDRVSDLRDRVMNTPGAHELWALVHNTEQA